MKTPMTFLIETENNLKLFMKLQKTMNTQSNPERGKNLKN
jgi:hypothetical protein